MLKTSIGNIYLKYFDSFPRWERIWKIAQVDFKKRYYNDKFGLLWALINPITQIVLFYFVFTRVFEKQQENFALFLFCGIIMWLSFSQGTSLGLRVLVNKRHLIENIQFNWLDLFSSHMIATLMGLAFNIIAYFITLLLLGVSIGKYFYLFPLVIIAWYLVTAALSIILALIRPVFDDINHIWSIMIMIGFWVSGIFYSGQYFIENHLWFAHLNPFVGIIMNTRACLLENSPIYTQLLFSNVAWGLIMYMIAVFLFKKYSRKIAEKL